ncbi:MAG: DUF481 domain-containing protein [Phycisphaerae bacterium]
MNQKKSWTIPFLILFAWSTSTIAKADEVSITLQSGEVIRGTLISEINGVVEINHAILGDLKIKRDLITRISPIPTTESNPSLKTPTPVSTSQRHALTDFTNPNTANESMPTSTAPNDVDALASRSVAHAGSSRYFYNNSTGALDNGSLLRTQPAHVEPTVAPIAKNPSDWKGQVELNATFVSADNTQLDLRTAAQAVHETDNDRFKAYAEYYLRTLSTSGSGIGSVTDNNLLTNITYDHFLNPTPWLWFTKGQYQYDANQGWENRLQGWGGMGYRFFDNPNFLLLTGKLGLGATHEFGSVDTTQPSGYAEIALGWQISERQKLSLSTYIAPDLSNFENYFVQTRFEWSMKLDIFSGLSLITGLRNDYQSQPASNSSGNDFRGYAGLKLEF